MGSPAVHDEVGMEMSKVSGEYAAHQTFMDVTVGV